MGPLLAGRGKKRYDTSGALACCLPLASVAPRSSLPTCCPQLSSPGWLPRPALPLRPASIRPQGNNPSSSLSFFLFIQTHSSEPLRSPPRTPTVPHELLTPFQGHSHQSAADTGLPRSSWNPRSLLQDNRLTPRLFPSPGISSSLSTGSQGSILCGFLSQCPRAPSFTQKGDQREGA